MIATNQERRYACLAHTACLYCAGGLPGVDPFAVELNGLAWGSMPAVQTLDLRHACQDSPGSLSDAAVRREFDNALEIGTAEFRLFLPFGHILLLAV